VAAALTVLLHNHWPGGKPVVLLTATKSHSGKDTVGDFICGNAPRLNVSYDPADGAMEHRLAVGLRRHPEAIVVYVGNARRGRGEPEISSAVLERSATDPVLSLDHAGSRGPLRRRNDVVFFLSTNDGPVSADLRVRSMAIQLDPGGDTAERVPPIGNPRLEFLPEHRDEIEAELHGMIRRWVLAGMPLDTEVRHPCTPWARVVGGILKVNGFRGFLANRTLRRTADDPERRALGLVGVHSPEAWRPAAEWAAEADHLGLARVLLGPDRRSPGRRWAMGAALWRHRDEAFEVEMDTARVTLRLEWARRAFKAGAETELRFRFVVLNCQRLPEGGSVGEEQVVS
jgi:hypothetical protein